jgi:hypothetical protein
MHQPNNNTNIHTTNPMYYLCSSIIVGGLIVLLSTASMDNESTVMAQTVGYGTLLGATLMLVALQFTDRQAQHRSAMQTFMPLVVILFICTLMLSFNTIYRQRLIEHRVSSSVYAFYWTIAALLIVHFGLLGYCISRPFVSPNVLYGLTILVGTVSVLITSTIGIILHYYSNDS